MNAQFLVTTSTVLQWTATAFVPLIATSATKMEAVIAVTQLPTIGNSTGQDVSLYPGTTRPMQLQLVLASANAEAALPRWIALSANPGSSWWPLLYHVRPAPSIAGPAITMGPVSVAMHQLTTERFRT